MNIAKGLISYPREAEIIGRLLGGYTSLEVDLMNCVKSVRQDLDTVIKAMYRIRGETSRIRIADAFGRQHYISLGLGQDFQNAIGAMKRCVSIRNQYAHSIWYDDNSGQLAFAHLEKIAEKSEMVNDLFSAEIKHVAIELLTKQFEFFEDTSTLLLWILNEGQKKSGRPCFPSISKPNLIFPALSVEE
jgi:hypothetical protein